ncbi:BaiN/RdsA family NAD(P)/FAD-dependent oxidoreductase [Cryomorpha ignava]|uniref:NAD(P)/FAD-dependent oxidoreductase n=1 Tax=Cryomorpha ignava TaxID=101383 RepID=UPI0019549865|nr:NAD(P)/FAD-dependent oxidoreductase [Cryomorpha ignava]
MIESYDIVVIGGGAAGFFAAIHAANASANSVVILEKTNKVLTKVAVSGGGRCNVTHDCNYPSQLVENYPRGGKKLRKSFELFDAKSTQNWFENREIQLKTESDGRVFPVSDNSKTIVDALWHAAEENGVKVHYKREVAKITMIEDGGFRLELSSGDQILAAKVIVTTGGFNKIGGYQWLKDLGLKIAKPVPSLFTFNVPDSEMKDLMGLSVSQGGVQIPGTKWKSEGPVLITHWGFSAPAVIKLSAWAAIYLNEINYKFPILINWAGAGEPFVREEISGMRQKHPLKVVVSNPMFGLPARLWEKLCAMAEISANLKFADLPAKKANKLMENLVRCGFNVSGKTTFKEEFVTCGGVELDAVNLLTFESKKVPGLYLAGEVLNVDGITGGFNFQHAWTSGYLAGKNAGESLH